MEGKLIIEAGKSYCVSCWGWNCWHPVKQPCDIDGCTCRRGSKDL